MQKICRICEENLKIDIEKIKNIVKIEIIIIIQDHIEVLRIGYVIQNIVCLKKISLVFS